MDITDAVEIVRPAFVTKLILGECDCCAKPNRVLHHCWAHGMETAACSECQGNPLADDIPDLQDEIDRRYEAGNWDHVMELHAALTEAMGSAICKALAA